MNLAQTVIITKIMQSHTILSIDERPGWLDLNLGEGCVAHVSKSGFQIWMKNNEYHREDGPAQEWGLVVRAWWLHGKALTQEDHARAVQEMKTGEISLV